MSGTVNIARALWDDPTFKDSEMSQREAWVWMIAEASWKPRLTRVGIHELSLQRGQLAASSRYLAAAWMWSEPRVRRYLDMLENRRMIRRVTDAGITVITICKYDEYQYQTRVDDAPPTQQPTQDRRTTDAKEKKGIREEVEEERPKGLLSLPIDDIAECVAAYNATADRAGWPKVQAVSKSRRAALGQRLKECGGATGWEVALAKAEASDFLCGRAGTPFKASFDFLTQASSFTKLMEGNYDNRIGNPAAPRRSGMVDAFAAVAAQRSGHS